MPNQTSPSSKRLLSYGSDKLEPAPPSTKTRHMDKRVQERLEKLENRCFRLERQLEMMYDDWDEWKAHVQAVKSKYPK